MSIGSKRTQKQRLVPSSYNILKNSSKNFLKMIRDSTPNLLGTPLGTPKKNHAWDPAQTLDLSKKTPHFFTMRREDSETAHLLGSGPVLRHNNACVRDVLTAPSNVYLNLGLNLFCSYSKFVFEAILYTFLLQASFAF